MVVFSMGYYNLFNSGKIQTSWYETSFLHINLFGDYRVLNGLNIKFASFVPPVILFILFCLALPACSSASQETPTAVPPDETLTLVPTATNTPLPTATTPTPLVILYTPPGSDADLSGTLHPTLDELSGKSGMRFEVKTELLESDFGDNLNLVVVIPPDPGVAVLAAAHPDVQFMVVGIPDLPVTDNIYPIAPQGGRPDQQGFLAGYLATTVTKDWRVGVISLADTTSGLAARQGFMNGVVFFCGLCRPVYPPFHQYPIYYELPTGASQEQQQAAADYLTSQAVKTVYVFPDAGGEALLTYLAQAGVNLIGGIDPPPVLKNNWIATIHVDIPTAVRQAWSDIIDGESKEDLSLQLQISNRNPNLFSPGRQRLVEEILLDLVSGYINTGVDPQTGEPR
jgi:hypothetical protein